VIYCAEAGFYRQFRVPIEHQTGVRGLVGLRDRGTGNLAFYSAVVGPAPLRTPQTGRYVAAPDRHQAAGADAGQAGDLWANLWLSGCYGFSSGWQAIILVVYRRDHGDAFWTLR